MAFASIDCDNCGNDFWERTRREGETVLKCTNCMKTRPYTKRRPNPSNGRTPSQKKKLDKIRRFFEDRGDWEGAEVKGKDLEAGDLSFVVKTHPDSYFRGGLYHFFMSRRGKVRVAAAEGPTLPDSHKAHVAKMLGASTV